VEERRKGEKYWEPRAPYVTTPRAPPSIRYNVVSQLAIARLGVAIHLARRRLDAVHYQLEMIHEVFDVSIDAMLRRQGYTPVIDLVRAHGQIIDCLLDNAQALPHLLHSYEVSIIDVPAIAYRDLKIKVVIA